MFDIKSKLAVRGVESLSDVELLSQLFEDVAARDLVAQRLMDLCDGDLSALCGVDSSQVRMFDGMGHGRAMRLVVACEIARRMMSYDGRNQEIHESEDVVKLFRAKVRELKHEECWALHLNSASRLVDIQDVSRGGIESTSVDGRIVVRRALDLLTTKIILVHNHPSGAVNPSDDDISFTRALRSAAALFDISLIDHIIVSSDDHFSFAANGLMK